MKKGARNDPRWLKVGPDAWLFVVHTFSAVDSTDLSHGLTARPDRFVFTDYGNVRCVGAGGDPFTFQNPLDPSTAGADFAGETIKQIADRTRQYNYDDANVISRNLRWVLRREGATWHLLYNPLHTESFKAMYKRDMLNARGNVSWGATTTRTSKHANLRGLFRTYCDALQVTLQSPRRLQGQRSYLDPVCNMIASGKQCRESSLFDDNLVTHDPTEVRASARILQTLGSGEPVPHCLCTGAPYNYVRSELDETYDFVYDFKDVRECDPSLNLALCNNIVQTTSGNVSFAGGSSLVSQCGGPSPPPSGGSGASLATSVAPAAKATDVAPVATPSVPAATPATPAATPAATSSSTPAATLAATPAATSSSTPAATSSSTSPLPAALPNASWTPGNQQTSILSLLNSGSLNSGSDIYTNTLDWFETYGPLVGGILFVLVIALVLFVARRRFYSRTPVPPAPSTIPVVPALPVSPAQAAPPAVQAVQAVSVM